MTRGGRRTSASPAGLVAVARRFDALGRPTAVEPYGTGHINDSYRVTCADGRRFLLQRINPRVFSEPDRLMANVRCVGEHLAAGVRSRPGVAPGWCVPELVPTRDGAVYLKDRRRGAWRMFTFVERSRMLDAVRTAEQAHVAAAAYGRFQRLLLDLSPTALHETIPHFHDTPMRYAALDRAVAAGRSGRTSRGARRPPARARRGADDAALPEIEFAQRRRPTAELLTARVGTADLPLRVAHYDAKVSNVLFDESCERSLCVIDWDTVMPGSVLYDFGDMVRAMTCTAPEDERDLSRVAVDMALFEAVAAGYLSEAGGFLTATERALLVVAARVITLEQGVRFLTDHLNGDVYYRVTRPGQNLDRCRTQFALLESIERQEARMSRLIRRILRARA